MFTLHPQIAHDCIEIGSLPLCRVLLMNNALFPWIILVPAKPGLSEITDLLPADRIMLMEEMAAVSGVLKRHVHADKMNIATLGNQVPQLHIHIIARFKIDSAWPNPVWGRGAEPYSDVNKEIETMQLALQSVSGFRPRA